MTDSLDPADYIGDLDPDIPGDSGNTGFRYRGGAEIRKPKQALVNSFPEVKGAVLATHEQMNALVLATPGVWEPEKVTSVAADGTIDAAAVEWTSAGTFKETTDTTHDITDGRLNPANGAIQRLTMAANVSLIDELTEGQGIKLEVIAGDEHLLTWPTMRWVGGSAPVLGSDDAILLTKEFGLLCGVYIGSY